MTGKNKQNGEKRQILRAEKFQAVSVAPPLGGRGAIPHSAAVPSYCLQKSTEWERMPSMEEPVLAVSFSSEGATSGNQLKKRKVCFWFWSTIKWLFLWAMVGSSCCRTKPLCSQSRGERQEEKGVQIPRTALWRVVTTLT